MIFYGFGRISIVINGPILKNNPTIWSHCALTCHVAQQIWTHFSLTHLRFYPFIHVLAFALLPHLKFIRLTFIRLEGLFTFGDI